ncbi:hypothetical protein [Bombella intestini]|nr:hypothetical protein [Bombella intestini]
MPVRWLFRMMMGVVLCLMMQLPLFVMPMAMAGGVDMPSSMTHLQSVVGMPDTMMEDTSSSRMAMEDSMAPCCQSHHAVCEAGLLPEKQTLAPVRMSEAAFPFYEAQRPLWSFRALPWRPPAALSV